MQCALRFWRPSLSVMQICLPRHLIKPSELNLEKPRLTVSSSMPSTNLCKRQSAAPFSRQVHALSLSRLKKWRASPLGLCQLLFRFENRHVWIRSFHNLSTSWRQPHFRQIRAAAVAPALASRGRRSSVPASCADELRAPCLLRQKTHKLLNLWVRFSHVMRLSTTNLKHQYSPPAAHYSQ